MMMTHDLASPAPIELVFDRSAIPDEVVVAADRRRLRLGWQTGETSTLSAQEIRQSCRCAWCTRDRIEGTFEGDFKDAAISAVEPVGGYALNIAFADGHARGVYPWVYLRAIGSRTDETNNGSSE